MTKSRYLIFFGLTVCGIALAYFAGKAIGEKLESRRYESLRPEREAIRRLVDSNLTTIDVGRKLLNWELERLSGERVTLAEIIEDSTPITFFSLDCASCLEQLDSRISTDALISSDDPWILISGGDPLELIRLQNALPPGQEILYDRQNLYSKALQIPLIPFTLIVDDSMLVHSILPESFGSDWRKEVESISK